MKVDSEAMLDAAFINAKKASPSGQLIVEEYMKGEELSIDSLVYNNEIYITGIADRIINREPYFIEIGHVMPSNLSKDLIDNAVEVFKKGIKALGINFGAAKGDIKVTEGGAKIVEIAARLSGGFMSVYTYPYSSGINLIQNNMDVCLGNAPSNLVPTKNRVSIERAIIPEPGIIKEITGVEQALSIPGVMNVFIHNKIGEQVVDPKAMLKRPVIS